MKVEVEVLGPLYGPYVIVRMISVDVKQVLKKKKKKIRLSLPLMQVTSYKLLMGKKNNIYIYIKMQGIIYVYVIYMKHE